MSYPLGAEYDSRAPWNEEPAEYKDCPNCFGTGEEPDSFDIGSKNPIQDCHLCEGTGKLRKTSEDYSDEYDSAMEQKYEESRDE